MKKLIPLFALALFTTIGLSFSVHAMEKTHAPTEAVHSSALKKAEPSKVCMINDALFEAPQIPVEVDGKTYYGCCSACESMLKTDTSARMATDPVSGNQVDKALAVIGVDSNDKAYYFENETNMMSYTPPSE